MEGIKTVNSFETTSFRLRILLPQINKSIPRRCGQIFLKISYNYTILDFKNKETLKQ